MEDRVLRPSNLTVEDHGTVLRPSNLTVEDHGSLQTIKPTGRNISNISGSQQDYLVGKSGSPQIYLVVIWPRFKQNNITNKKFDKYSQYYW